MINSDNLCMSCMKDIGDSKQCPYCGFHADSQQITPYLPIRTVLGNRYLVGKLLEYNGDGATYMGLDLSTREAVNIREFFPEGIAQRDPKTMEVSAEPTQFGVYNECLQEFVEMWRKLMRLSGLSALIKVQEVFESNGTCYAITENVDGITFREYLLRNNVGYIPWERARLLLMPVLSTLGTLHSVGIIHRGISPTTLVVAPDGKLRITGFSIGQARSAGGRLKQQMFTGYTAYEQYTFEGRQGPWTDIYAFGAVLYRALIGTDPIDAKERVVNDRLMVPGKFAEQLPAYVINGLVNALQIIPDDRTRSVEELRAELSASPSAAAGSAPDFDTVKTTLVDSRLAHPIEEDEEELTADKREAAQKRHNRSAVVISVAAIVIILAVAFLVLWQTGVLPFDKDATTNSVQAETVDVPNFVGKLYDDVVDDAYYMGNFTIEKSEAYSSTVEEGFVINQSIDVNAKVPKGTTITLKVSKGKEMITFPTAGIIGADYDTAAKTLAKLGFNVTKTDKLNTGGQIANTVANASLEAGESYEKGTLVYLFVWSEEETTTTDPSIDEDLSSNLSDIGDQIGGIIDDIKSNIQGNLPNGNNYPNE